MTTTTRIVMLALMSTAVLVGARGCGGVKASRAEARDATATATCDRYQQCKYIGPGLNYETRESCDIFWTSFWESAWPAADCEGRIDEDAYHVCLNRIASTDCTSFGDFLGTLGVCAKQNVCIGVDPDAGR